MSKTIDELMHNCIDNYIRKIKRVKRLDSNDEKYQIQMEEIFHHAEKAIELLQTYRMVNAVKE